MSTDDEAVVRHYSRGGLERAIRDGLTAMGRDPDRVQPDDLAAVDEFHMGGHQATVSLAERLGLGPGSAHLDIGSGLGGPARFFGRRYGCTVVGVDLTPEYVAVAAALTRMVGLAERVTFCLGSATALPFDAARFDAATLLHVGMNVPDKARLCAEAARVLKPGGIFVVYDVMRVGRGELAFPVAWAADPEASFLAEPAVYRQALAAAGFEIVAEENRRELGLEVFRKAQARAADGPPPLGVHLLLGPAAPRKLANLVANLERGLIAPIEMLCRRR